tara:strand:+ start:1751 stop:2977 length:1227 start_codon:yes stop_codon:yes gene_type:complete
MEFEIFTLSNGIRVIHQEVDSPASHCGFTINAGSRDEAENEHGLAHFLEHSIFKGTQKRKAFHILNRIDAVGGELNAFTSKEDTVIHASFLPHHYERAIELLADITFHSVFPPKEIKKEKDIIIDEISSYNDSPGEQIFDDFEDQIYKGHPLGRSILGTRANLQQLGQPDLIHFMQKHYVTENVVFSSVGKIKTSQLKRLLEKHLAPIPSRSHNEQREVFSGYKPENVIIEKDVYQAHLMLGNVAYSYPDERRRAMILLNNILGGPAMNSRLNLNISEKYGFAYNLESNYASYSDTGVFNIYLGTEKNALPKATELIHKELKKLRDTKLGTRQLASAKEQFKGQLALSQESGASLMIALGKSLLAFDKVDTLEEIYTFIDNITAEEILEIANEVFDPHQLSSLTFLPR